MRRDRGRTRTAKSRIDKIVGTNIKKERMLRRMSRDELASIIDLTASHLGLIERGERGATPLTMEKVVEAFGISVDSLFSDPAYSNESTINQCENAGDTYFKKVSALATNLAEPELEFLSHVIDGLVKARTDGEVS